MRACSYLLHLHLLPMTRRRGGRRGDGRETVRARDAQSLQQHTYAYNTHTHTLSLCRFICIYVSISIYIQSYMYAVRSYMHKRARCGFTCNYTNVMHANTKTQYMHGYTVCIWILTLCVYVCMYACMHVYVYMHAWYCTVLSCSVMLNKVKKSI